MKEKFETHSKFKEFWEKVEREYGMKIQYLCTNNREEYMSK